MPSEYSNPILWLFSGRLLVDFIFILKPIGCPGVLLGSRSRECEATLRHMLTRRDISVDSPYSVRDKSVLAAFRLCPIIFRFISITRAN